MSTENFKFEGTYLEGPKKGEKFIGWDSRSMAVVVIIAMEGVDDMYFLVEKRGPGCPDNIGKYVFPCGYLNRDETLAEAACRELYEETGLKASPSDMKFVGYEDSPGANRQNVTMRFVYSPDLSKIKKNLIDGIINSNTKDRGGEGGECDDIKIVSGKWIKENANLIAFGHENLAALYGKQG